MHIVQYNINNSNNNYYHNNMHPLMYHNISILYYSLGIRARRVSTATPAALLLIVKTADGFRRFSSLLTHQNQRTRPGNCSSLL